MTISGFGIKPFAWTVSGLPQCDTGVIQKLAGKPDQGKYGLAYDHFKNLGKEKEGIECCEALSNWIKFKSIETLL